MPAIIQGAHDAGARVVVDNTFLTPLLQRPLELGADLVLHSATKYLAGHSDAQMGAVVTRDEDVYAVLKGRRDVQGNGPGPFEAWLALRGLRTLHLRVERAQANAAELARRLADHPLPTEVRYPGLGGMVSIVLPSPTTPTCWSARPRCGSTPPASAASSRRSSAGAAGSPSPRRSPRVWSGSRWASRTSTTSGPTWQALDGIGG